jgi:hypothetical protein
VQEKQMLMMNEGLGRPCWINYDLIQKVEKAFVLTGI